MACSAYVVQGLPSLAVCAKAPAGKAGVKAPMADPVGSGTEYGETLTLAKPVTVICGGEVPLEKGWGVKALVKPTGTEIFRVPGGVVAVPAGAIKPRPVPTYTRLHTTLV